MALAMPVSHVYMHSAVLMDTLVRVRVSSTEPEEMVWEQVQRAFQWFLHIERVCSRFEADSEVSRLSQHVGQPVRVSELLFQTLRFALDIALLTDGAFDPTLGYVQEARGFNRNYRTGELVRSNQAASPAELAARSSFRDVHLDPATREVMFLKPLLLDLGAVAKGLAIDLAARELDMFADFFIDAGGDIYVKGRNETGQPWRVGIRHPRLPNGLAAVMHLTHGAVCTSGDYERGSPVDGGHHLFDLRTGRSPTDIAAVAVIAPTAMLADVLSTAVSLLGVKHGLELLEQQGVDGLVITSALEQHTTRQFDRYLA